MAINRFLTRTKVSNGVKTNRFLRTSRTQVIEENKPIPGQLFTPVPEADRIRLQPKKPLFTFSSAVGGGQFLREGIDPTARNISTEKKAEIRGGTFQNTLKEINHIISVGAGGTNADVNLNALKDDLKFVGKIKKLFGFEITLADVTNRQQGRIRVENELIKQERNGEISREELVVKLKGFDFLQEASQETKQEQGKRRLQDVVKVGNRFLQTGADFFTKAILPRVGVDIKKKEKPVLKGEIKIPEPTSEQKRNLGELLGLKQSIEFDNLSEKSKDEVKRFLFFRPDKPALKLKFAQKTGREQAEEIVTAPIRFTAGSLARFVTQIGLEKLDSDIELMPRGRFQELLLFDEPIVRLSEQSLTARLTEENLKKAGFGEGISSNVALGAAIAIGGLIENPFIAGTGKVGKELLKKSLREVIEKETGEKLGIEALEFVSKKADDIIKLETKKEREKATKELVDQFKKEEPIEGLAKFKPVKEVPEISKVEPEKVLVKAEPEGVVVKPKPKQPSPVLGNAEHPINKADEVLQSQIHTTKPKSIISTNQKSNIRRTGQKTAPGFTIEAETRLQWLQRQIQDKMNRLKNIQTKIQKTGEAIPEEADAYLKQELYVGKAAQRIDNFENDFVEPFLAKAGKKNVDIDELGLYLYARHAPERNIQIAKINPKLPKGGSGMTDEQASNIIKAFEKQGKAKDLEEFAKEFYDKVTNARLKILKEAGLEKGSVVDQLDQFYQNYVPLKGKQGIESLGSVGGKGFSVSGKDIRRAFGRESRANNPLVQALLDHEDALVRSEKNKVGQAFLKLVEDNPNPKIWTVESQKFVPRFDKTGELQFLDPKFKFADNVLQVKIDGKIKLITIHDKALAEAMKNMGTERGFQVLQQANSYLRAVNTTMNPEFIITNFQRDLQTALINIGGEQSLKMAKDVAKDVPKAMQGIWRNIRKGDVTSEWGKTYQELKETGGRVGFFDMKTVEKKLNELTRRIGAYNKVKTTDKMSAVVKGVGDYIVAVNEVVEMAVRTSAYKHALAQGISKGKAASLAKNLTVNFNKKGNWGVALNTMYLFANASIQGSARVITALRHKSVRKIVAAVTASSFALNEMNRAINEEEYSKISDFDKNSNWIFMLPNGNRLKIKLPYGFNIFKILGDISNDMVHGETNLGEGMTRFVVALDDAYNPLSSSDLTQTLTPTLVDPIVQTATNKNWFGGPIKPDQLTFGAQKRESALYWQSVRPQTKAITEWLNTITGGSEIEAGFIDISPEIIDHYTDFLTGGTGKFMSNTIGTGVSLSQGEFPKLQNIPFARKVIAEPSEFQAQGATREVIEKSGTKELSEKDLDVLRGSIKDQLEAGTFDEEDAVKKLKEINRNQARIMAGRVFTEIKNASAEEKAKAIQELNSLERKELIKLIKKAAESESEK